MTARRRSRPAGPKGHGRGPQKHGVHPVPVSVIVPARDAEATLPEALESILAQDYDAPVEVIVADGSGGDATRQLLRCRFPGVRRVENPDRTIPAALNRAFAAASHRIIARCDAHSTLPPDYLARAVGTLQRTGAANVGGRQHPAGRTRFERAVALATRSRLGAGDARYRIGGPEGPVDTVFLGVFRRDALEAAGGWDETLERNEDYELNWRLREAGATVWFDPALAAAYRPRGTVAALARQYFDYGRWKAVVLARHPGSWRARQLAPAALAAMLIASGGLLGMAALVSTPGLSAALRLAAAAVPFAYALALIVASAAIGWRYRCAEALLVPMVAATIHLAWAGGFLFGLPAAVTSLRATDAPQAAPGRPAERCRGSEPG